MLEIVGYLVKKSVQNCKTTDSRKANEKHTQRNSVPSSSQVEILPTTNSFDPLS